MAFAFMTFLHRSGACFGKHLSNIVCLRREVANLFPKIC
jgi:hypothetical protein